MRELPLPVLIHQKQLSQHNQVHHKAVDFQLLLSADQKPVVLLRGIDTQQSNDDYPDDDDVIAWRQLINVLQEEHVQVVDLDLKLSEQMYEGKVPQKLEVFLHACE